MTAQMAIPVQTAQTTTKALSDKASAGSKAALGGGLDRNDGISTNDDASFKHSIERLQSDHSSPAAEHKPSQHVENSGNTLPAIADPDGNPGGNPLAHQGTDGAITDLLHLDDGFDDSLTAEIAIDESAIASSVTGSTAIDSNQNLISGSHTAANTAFINTFVFWLQRQIWLIRVQMRLFH